MKTIIYYRKSTDRDDKQANSLEHQLENCLRVAKKYELEIVEQIGESRSAKTEGTRDGFNRLVKMCKTGKIDYIVIDEPKRLSRNNIDTSRIIDLMDKKLIKGVLGSGREYRSDNSRDKFLLQLDLSLSKMDNEDRSKDIKDKMTSCIKNHRRFLSKAPFGYDNITIKKGFKDIKVNQKEAKIVKEIFKLRCEGKAYNTICIDLRLKYGKIEGLSLNASRLQKMVCNKFYYGVFTWAKTETLGTHKPLITKEIYNKANSLGYGVYQHKKPLEVNLREYRPYYFKGFIKTKNLFNLTAYTKKGNIYYTSIARDDIRVNINEKLLFEKAGEIVKQFDVENEYIKEFDRKILLELVNKKYLELNEEIIDYDKQIENLLNKQDKLLDMSLEGSISKEIYIKKNNEIKEEILSIKDIKKSIKKDDLLEKTRVWLELTGSLYSSYFRLNEAGKIEMLRKLRLELFVDTKKELQIGNNSLLESSNLLNFSYGIPKGNGTPVWTVRGSRPSH